MADCDRGRVVSGSNLKKPALVIDATALADMALIAGFDAYGSSLEGVVAVELVRPGRVRTDASKPVVESVCNLNGQVDQANGIVENPADGNRVGRCSGLIEVGGVVHVAPDADHGCFLDGFAEDPGHFFPLNQDVIRPLELNRDWNELCDGFSRGQCGGESDQRFGQTGRRGRWLT